MEPIAKISITEQTVKSIQNFIKSSEYNPGDKLPSESIFSQKLQVGRSTVREALRILQAKGVIDIVHGKGAFVANAPPASRQSAVDWFAENKIHLEDLMNVRLAIEQMSVKLAVYNVTEKSLEELQKIQDQFVVAVDSMNVAQMAALDELLHSKVCDISNNALLISILRQISEPMRTYRLNSFAIPENCHHAITHHQAILDSLKARSMERALNAITEHIKSSLADMRDVIASVKHDDTVF
ncbi:MAG: FadR/GntR family transcriptional regulator [Oscillospiraceae bacterium]